MAQQGPERGARTAATFPDRDDDSEEFERRHARVERPETEAAVRARPPRDDFAARHGRVGRSD